MRLVAQPRLVLLTVGIACMALGAVLGWVAARQTARGPASAVSATAAAETARAAEAATQAAVSSEGWARAASGAYTLVKTDAAAAQTARRQAREFALRAEKAAADANAAAARAALDRKAAGAARAATAASAAAPVTAPVVRRAAKPIPKPVAAPLASASDEGCRRAIIFERTAAGGSIPRQAAYNAAMSGFAMNSHCAEPQHTLIEAYLLAQRASAEGPLHVGNWRADLARSDQLLMQCTKRPEYRGAAGAGCRARLRKNQRIRQTLSAR